MALKRGILVPVIRDIEPPELVYKKCLNDVIVVAKIPEDAEVRYSPRRGKCRSNKAIIVDILGDFYGQKVGIAYHDRTTTYAVGDKVVVDNFDMSSAECAPGFHFFRTEKEAKNYDFS